MCLRFDGSAGTSSSGFGTVGLAACDRENDHRLYWHRGNRDVSTGRCCSGIRAWNTDQCLQSDANGILSTGICDVTGRNYFQLSSHSSHKQVLKAYDRCITVETFSLQAVQCSRPHISRWEKIKVFVPIERELYDKARRENPDMFSSAEWQLQAALKSSTCGGPFCECVDGGCFSLYLESSGSAADRCLDSNAKLVEDTSDCMDFFLKDQKLRLVLNSTFCVDRGRDDDPETWNFTACLAGLETQTFKVHGGSACNAFDECFRTQ